MWSKSWFSALIPHTVIIFTNFVASRSNKWANSFRLLGTRYLFSTFCTRNHSQEDSNLDHQSRRHMCSSVYHHNSSVLNYVSLLSNMKVLWGHIHNIEARSSSSITNCLFSKVWLFFQDVYKLEFPNNFDQSCCCFPEWVMS